jgi:hypothetical protein
MRRTTLLVLCASAVLGCREPAAPSSDWEPSGVYSYLARIGVFPVVEGTLTLVVAADSSVTGTWELQRVPASDTNISVGPQLGSGRLQGRLSATGIWVDLNPGWADNNVFLALDAKAYETLSGTWDHSTIIGPVTGGPVQLRRLQR